MLSDNHIFGPMPHMKACFHADPMRQFINDYNQRWCYKKKRWNVFRPRLVRGWTRLFLFAAQLFQFCNSILSQHLRWLLLRWRSVLQVRQSGRYGFLRVATREEGREETRRQIVLNKSRHCSGLFSLRAYLGLFSRSFHCTRRSSPSSSLRSTLRCSFRPPVFSTFVNVVVLSSDPLVACISKRLITRHLTAIVIYNFHYIIRRFVKLIAPLESWSLYVP